MVTLLVFGNSDGMRRCDATCYDARTGTRCECICGGRNHGAGLQLAREQTAVAAQRWLEEWNRRHKDAPVEWPAQPHLFDRQVQEGAGLEEFVRRGRAAQETVDGILERQRSQELQP